MSPQQAEDGASHVERRGAVRFKFDGPVHLKMPSGVKLGKLSDISEGGAKIEISNPPVQGASILMSWGPHEEFCKVVWVTEGACGVQFERPISRALVLETTGQDEEAAAAAAGPIANRDNIPQGRKRRRLGAAG